MKEAILMTLTLLALGCTHEDVGPDPDALGSGDAPPAVAVDGGLGGDCNEMICHDYGGGIEECTCTDDGQAALDLGPPPAPDPDPYD